MASTLAGNGNTANGTNLSSYTVTLTSAATANEWQYLFIANQVTSGTAGAVSSVSGGGLTWTLVDTQLFDGNLKRLTVYRGTAASPSGTSITVTFGTTQAGFQGIAVQTTGVDGTTPTPSGQVTKGTGTATRPVTGTLAGSLASADSFILGCAGIDVNAAITKESGATDYPVDGVGHASPASALGVQWRGNDTALTFDSAANRDWGYIVLELQAAVTVQTITVPKTASEEQVFSPSSLLNIELAKLASGEQTFSPSTLLNVEVPKLATEEQIFNHTLRVLQTITGSFVTTGAQVFGPRVDEELQAAFVATAAQVFGPRVDEELRPAFLGSGANVFVALLRAVQQIAPGKVSSGEGVFEGTVQFQQVTGTLRTAIPMFRSFPIHYAPVLTDRVGGSWYRMELDGALNLTLTLFQGAERPVGQLDQLYDAYEGPALGEVEFFVTGGTLFVKGLTPGALRRGVVGPVIVHQPSTGAIWRAGVGSIIGGVVTLTWAQVQ